MNSDLNELINKLSNDFTKSLKTNLTVFVEKNATDNEFINNLKALLFKLPEYINLDKKYEKLFNEYNELLKKYD